MNGEGNGENGISADAGNSEDAGTPAEPEEEGNDATVVPAHVDDENGEGGHDVDGSCCADFPSGV